MSEQITSRLECRREALFVVFLFRLSADTRISQLATRVFLLVTGAVEVFFTASRNIPKKLVNSVLEKQT